MLEFPELGMEAIWKIEVEDFPAFVIVDDKGNDFFKVADLRGACKRQPKLFLGYRLRTTREANKSPSDVSVVRQPPGSRIFAFLPR